MEPNIQDYIKQCHDLVNATLKKVIPADTSSHHLYEAINYAVFNGGKRLRAALIYATNEGMGGVPSQCHYICAAIELLNAASLIIDDLPALDDDSLRRGKLTCHKVFGQGTAIIAANALICLAFEVLAELHESSHLAPLKEIEIITLVSKTVVDMASGEELDIELNNTTPSIQDLERIYHLKTGCFLQICLQLGALSAGCTDPNIINNLKKFGDCIGLLFQIHDDIIGIESDTKTLGKSQNQDLKKNKPSYPSIATMEVAKKREQELFKEAFIYLKKTNREFPKLEALAHLMIRRTH